ncbi:MULTISPECIES: hypothetical protein [unclassified Wolbachia]|uniref:hypothetical protein n=1 Tax=unclassified Wolbachia TaxID=2640676 RepID=UPI003132F99B
MKKCKDAIVIEKKEETSMLTKNLFLLIIVDLILLSIDPELPRTLLAEASPTRGCPKRSRGEGLEKHPRRRSKKEEETEPFRGVLGEIDPSQPTCGQSQLSLGAGEGMLTEANIRDQKMTCRPSSIPFPIAWDNSMSLNSGVSEDSPKDMKNICNEEPEKQQVTDKSDRKSSDECFEAKSQESESPEKKHGGGVQKIKKLLSSPFKKQYGVNLKRHDVGRDTTRSTPGTPVTEKPPVSKPFFSFPTRIKAKNNPPSGVTSPTHEGGPEWQQRLDPDQREELCKVLSPEMKEKLNSGFFLPEYEKLLHLLYVDSETLRSLLSTSEGAEQVCSVLPPEKGKQLHSDLPFKAKKGLLFKFFDDEQEISRNVSTSSADSGYSSGLPASPAVPHKKSVSSEFKKCSVQQVKHMSEALEKNGGF